MVNDSMVVGKVYLSPLPWFIVCQSLTMKNNVIGCDWKYMWNVFTGNGWITGGASGGGSLGSAATSSPASPSALATSWLTWLLFPVQLVFNFVWSFIFPTSVVSIDAAGAPPTAGAAAANAAASRQRTDETWAAAFKLARTRNIFTRSAKAIKSNQHVSIQIISERYYLICDCN